MVLMNLFAGQEERHRCKERTCGRRRVGAGGEGQGGTNWESITDIGTLLCVK